MGLEFACFFAGATYFSPHSQVCLIQIQDRLSPLRRISKFIWVKNNLYINVVTGGQPTVYINFTQRLKCSFFVSFVVGSFPFFYILLSLGQVQLSLCSRSLSSHSSSDYACLQSVLKCHQSLNLIFFFDGILSSLLQCSVFSVVGNSFDK